MYRILDISKEMFYIWYMDSETLLSRLGIAFRELRRQRGLTQAEVADRVGLPRGKIIQAEKGDPSVSIRAYARLASALGAEFTVRPARRPTLDEIGELLAHD